jgi:hypothetical protein
VKQLVPGGAGSPIGTVAAELGFQAPRMRLDIIISK